MDNKIIAFFEGSNKNSFVYEELIKKMNIRGEKNLKTFKRNLDRLIANGLLYFNSSEKTYMLFRNTTNMYKGTLLIDSKKRYYIIDNNSKCFINSNDLNNASYGDYVLVAYNMKRKRNEVKQVLKRDNNKYVAKVILFNGKLCISDDRFDILEIINGKKFKIVEGNLVVFEKKRDKAYVDEVICHVDDANANILKVVYEYGFTNEFSDSVKEELKNIPSSLSNEEINSELISGRVDLRDKDMVTIDCDTTKDIDDGVYIEKNDDGTFSLYVCIADVSHYIKDGSALAARIKEVGTSVYPPGCVIPMLPRELSNGICSLNPHVDRFAICFKSTFDNNGNLLDFNIFKAVVNSKLKMTYSNVDKILEKNEMVSGYEKYYKQLLMMEKLYLKIQDIFYKNGFLEFGDSEIELILNDEDKVKEIVNSNQGVGAKIIEFFMLITNKNACEFFSNLGIPLIYRVDEEPDYNKISDILVMLQDKKILSKDINPFDKNGNKRDFYSKSELQKILFDLRKVYLPDAFYQMFIHAMSKARFSSDNIGHYPLGLPYYAQFTSPIRRGGDWRNHTILDHYLRHNGNFAATHNGNDVATYNGNGAATYNGNDAATDERFNKKSLGDEANNFSDKERKAEAVEAEVIQMLLLKYIDLNKEEINRQELVGRIYEIGSNVRVLLENGVKGKIFIPINNNVIMNNDLYVGSDLLCSVGDIVSVKVDSVKYKTGEIIFLLDKNLKKEYGLNGKKKSKKKTKDR